MLSWKQAYGLEEDSLLLLIVFFVNLERGGILSINWPPPTSLPLLCLLCSSASARKPTNKRREILLLCE